jgi:hypothetical protein
MTSTRVGKDPATKAAESAPRSSVRVHFRDDRDDREKPATATKDSAALKTPTGEGPTSLSERAAGPYPVERSIR